MKKISIRFFSIEHIRQQNRRQRNRRGTTKMISFLNAQENKTILKLSRANTFLRIIEICLRNKIIFSWGGGGEIIFCDLTLLHLKTVIIFLLLKNYKYSCVKSL